MAHVDVDGLGQTQRRLDGLAADVRLSVVRHLQNDEAQPLLHAMRSRASRMGTLSRIAGSTLAYSRLPDGGSVSAGGTGSSLGVVLFAGTEYGGQKRRNTYARRSPKGKAHAVTRRTTMMFRPHLGTRGYWYWPSVRKETRGIVGRTRQAMEKAVDHG